MKQIFFDLNVDEGKVLFIRYNPDTYKPSYGRVFTKLERLNYLVKYVKMFDQKDMGLKVLYLFYDGFTQLSENTDYINPYDTIL